MRQQGRIIEWNEDRGFGFITPLEGGSRVFVHVSAFPHEGRRPKALDLVTYADARDQRGRPRAEDVLFLAPAGTSGRVRPTQPVAAGSQLNVPLLLTVVLFVLAGVVGTALYVAGLGRTSAPTAPVSAGVASEVPLPNPTAEETVAAPTKPAPTLEERVLAAAKARATARAPQGQAAASSDDAIGKAFRDHASGVGVTGAGVVDRVLSDDNEGGRHQRFILRLSSGQTLLVAHNIDIAPRVPGLKPGDSVEFKGDYEWNPEGGVIHWTHHDPDGGHASGWLRRNGQTYQ